MKVAAVVLALFALVSCSRDPNVVKKRYLENGNKYFAKAKYKEASIMYRNALQKDLRYGPAYYHLALTELKLGRVPNAVNALRRAIELIPKEQPDHVDATVKLAEVYLQVTRDKNFLNEVETIAGDLLKKDPNSWDGHRLSADLNFVRAQLAYRAGDKENGKKQLDSAIAEYRKADSIKTGSSALTLSLARALAASQDFPEAEKLYRQLIEKDKTLSLAYTELYQLYLFQNKANEAEGVLKTAITNNPKQYGFLTLLAAHYYGLKRRDDMVKVLEQMKSKKDFQQAYITAGDFYLRLGEGDEAIKQYKEGITADEKRKGLYQKRIIEVLMRQGKRGDAAEINSAILKDNPTDNDARGLQASLLLDKGDIQKAISELQSVVTAAPDNFVARYNLGRAHLARAEWEQARQQFMQAIKLRPDYIPARLALAQLQVTRGEFEGALKSVQEILQIDKQNANARLIESAALMGMKKFGDSRNLLQSMLKADPNSAEVLFQLGAVDLAENKYKDAEDSFRKAYQLNPANSRGLMGMVETYMAQNKTDQALQLLDEEARRAPNRGDLRLALGNTAVRAGKFDLAIAEFTKVLSGLDQKSKAAGDLYLRIGETYRRKGDLNNAIVALQKSKDVLPESPAVISTLALTLDGAGRRQEARQAYEQTLRIDPRNGVALNNLAYLMAESGGDLDQALTYAQRAKQILPNLSEVSDTLGWIYLKKNLSDNAIEIFKDLVTKQPTHSTYRFHLGMALSQKGDKVRALKELQEALKSNPPKDEATKIRELIARLG